MELQGTAVNIGAIEEKGAAKFKVAKMMLYRKTTYQGQEYPNFTEVTFHGKRTDLLKERNVAEGDYVKVNGDLQGRYFEHQGEQKFAQDFVAWSLEIVRKKTLLRNRKNNKAMESIVKQEKIKRFAAGFKKKPATKQEKNTVGELGRSLRTFFNHEFKRTCNSCGTEFDVRKTLEFSCPECGSTDLRVGWTYRRQSSPLNVKLQQMLKKKPAISWENKNSAGERFQIFLDDKKRPCMKVSAELQSLYIDLALRMNESKEKEGTLAQITMSERELDQLIDNLIDMSAEMKKRA